MSRPPWRCRSVGDPRTELSTGDSDENQYSGDVEPFVPEEILDPTEVVPL